MIPHLINSLRKLSVIEACMKATMEIDHHLTVEDPHNGLRQLPKIGSTLTKKFCIDKFFRAVENYGCQSKLADKPRSDVNGGTSLHTAVENEDRKVIQTVLSENVTEPNNTQGMYNACWFL